MKADIPSPKVSNPALKQLSEKCTLFNLQGKGHFFTLHGSRLTLTAHGSGSRQLRNRKLLIGQLQREFSDVGILITNVNEHLLRDLACY